jgi:hypothetical protein
MAEITAFWEELDAPIYGVLQEVIFNISTKRYAQKNL